MTDYQELFSDSMVNDMVDLLYSFAGDIIDSYGLDENIDNLKVLFEDMAKGRIEAYDNERREQYIKALSESLPRLVSEVI